MSMLGFDSLAQPVLTVTSNIANVGVLGLDLRDSRKITDLSNQAAHSTHSINSIGAGPRLNLPSCRGTHGKFRTEPPPL